MSRVRQFAMMPCDMDTWAGWTDLTCEEQWAYKLLRQQRDITAAGTNSILLARWASEAADMTRDRFLGIMDRLAQKGYIVLDLEREEILICWFMTTDHVYKKPNPMTAAITAIAQVRSPGIKTAIHNEMKALLQFERHQVPVEMEPTIIWLIGELEPYAVIGTSQPLHNPSSIPVLPMNRSKARHVQGVRDGSAADLGGLFTGDELPQAGGEPGQDNRSLRVPSLDTQDVIRKTDTRTFPPPDGDGADGQISSPRAGIAPAGDVSPKPPAPETAQTLLAGWIDLYRKETGGIDPSARVKGPVAKILKETLAERTPYEVVRRGLWEWHKRRLHPSALPSVISEVLLGPGERNGNGRFVPGTGAGSTPNVPTSLDQLIV